MGENVHKEKIQVESEQIQEREKKTTNCRSKFSAMNCIRTVWFFFRFCYICLGNSQLCIRKHYKRGVCGIYELGERPVKMKN